MDTNEQAYQTTAPGRAPRLPPRWIIRSIWALHRGAYAATRGRFGLRMAGADRSGMLLLRTVGRRTGKERTRILAYVEDGPDLVTLAMNGWGKRAPAWWLNLQASPDATVELAVGSRRVRARVADADERPRLWARLQGGMWGDIDGFAAMRATETPVVILARRD